MVEDIIIEPATPWLLSDEQRKALRSGEKFWKRKRAWTKRPAICRNCGSTIPSKTQTVQFTHVNVTIRQYDLKGFVCGNFKKCDENREENLLLAAHVAWQEEQVEELLAEQPEIASITVEELRKEQ
jgi:hypothetical protein